MVKIQSAQRSNLLALNPDQPGSLVDTAVNAGRSRLADLAIRIELLGQTDDGLTPRPEAMALSGFVNLAVINGTSGADYIHRSGDGLVAPGGYNEILGTTTGADSLSGYGGDDIIYGDSGNDIIDGGIGADVMFGGAGADTYYVDNKNDAVVDQGSDTDLVIASVNYTLGGTIENLTFSTTKALNGTGNGLNNIITGNNGANTLEGLGGFDTLYGGLGADTLLGGADGDNLYGGDGDDTIDGGDGNDQLSGETGVDTLIGGLGNDSYYVSGAELDILVEALNGGYDYVYANGSFTLADNLEYLRINMNGSPAMGGGNGQDNYIEATGSGPFELRGFGGNDTLRGNIGDDVIYGGTGVDIMSGFGGNDTYHVDNGGDVISDTSGVDTVNASITYTIASGLENLILSGEDGITGTGNSGVNNLYGNDAGNMLFGLFGDDSLFGNGGDDTLDGGVGSDVMFGGAGNDIYYVDSLGDTISEQFGDGIDTIITGLDWTLAAPFENLTLTGTANVSGRGNEQNNTLWGNDFKNTLRGGLGDDILNGQQGNDKLIGGDGDDNITGAQGVDKLTGDAGADTFVFKTPGGSLVGAADSITDFSQFEGDRIDFREMDANTTLAGDQAFVLGGSSFSGNAGELIQRVDGAGRTILQGDINGDAVADFEIRILTGQVLNISDFYL